MTAVRKEDKSLLSSLGILSALLVHLVKSVFECIVTRISVLSDVLICHPEALEALNELLAIVF